MLTALLFVATTNWTNYLCEYGEDHQTHLIRVNEQDRRVTTHDADPRRLLITARELERAAAKIRKHVYNIHHHTIKRQTTNA